MRTAAAWRRTLVAVTVLATLGTPSMGAEAAEYPDNCTFAVHARPTVLAHSHGHATRGRWRLAATAGCSTGAIDLRLSADLTRNGVPLPGAHLSASCPSVCDGQFTISSTTIYSQMSGRWQPRLVVFFRGPTSLVAFAMRDHCVLDVPSFDSICTLTGPTVSLR